jgi:hypothetical protein
MRGAALLFLMFVAVPAAAQPVCLQRTRAESFAPRLGERSVIVTDNGARKYLVEFGGVCRALDHPRELGFQTLDPSRIGCVERGDQLVSRHDVGAGGLGATCVVRAVKPYTAEMEKADAIERAMEKLR